MYICMKCFSIISDKLVLCIYQRSPRQPSIQSRSETPGPVPAKSHKSLERRKAAGGAGLSYSGICSWGSAERTRGLDFEKLTRDRVPGGPGVRHPAGPCAPRVPAYRARRAAHGRVQCGGIHPHHQEPGAVAGRGRTLASSGSGELK